jgi:HJR/Mrr/RecB family endonuclease
MVSSESYKVGHSYIDDIANSKDKDQFVKWLPGMGNSGGVRPVKFKNIKTDLPAYIILITRQTAHHHYNPWDDIVDYVSGKIYYWGDAKFNKDKNYKDFAGNKILLKTYENVLDANYASIPPILHFSKTESGKITFNGLCVIRKLEMTWYEDKGKPVKNYRSELIILDEEEVSVAWLNERANCKSPDEISKFSPPIWCDYIKGRTKKIEVFKKEIKSTEEQLPNENTEDAKILESLTELNPTQFEAVLVELFREMPHIHHNILRTRAVKDGGFDFIGEFTIPFPLKYKIEFLGEAKKYNRKNSVGPEMVSRLVARLGRGQYGIFVTTSYYTKQAQTEVLEDGYPVKLYSGIDLVNFLREQRLIDSGKIKSGWIDSVTEKND